MASLLAAWASWLRGGRYVYTEPDDDSDSADQEAESDRRQTALAGAADETSARLAVARRWPSSSIAQVEAG